MTERYTILRIPRKSSAGLESMGPEASAEPSIDVAHLSTRDVHDLRKDPEVGAFAPVMPLKLIKPVDMPGQSAATSAWGISAVGADRSTYDGSGIAVAVLDTGIAANHPAFVGVELVQEDFTGGGNGEQNGHGTHCAATIFGRDVEGKRIGIARGISKALIGKVLGGGGGNSDALFQGISWALGQGARVISMSLSFDFPGLVSGQVTMGWPVELATSRALETYRLNLRMLDSLMTLVSARAELDGGAVVVAASGNESTSQYRLSVSVPAVAQGIISVGALSQGADGLSVAEFSNSLPEVSAPGVDILSADPGGGLISRNGTSMAAPHVAGVAALWWQALQATAPRLKASRVAAQLLATARTTGFSSDVNIPDRGAGIITAP